MSTDARDSALVALARAGDRGALGVLLERHRPLAWRLAVRLLGEAPDADDVVQEACLQAMLGLDRLRDPDRFGPWLAGIALNLARMRLRARRDVPAPEDWDGGRRAPGFRWPETQPGVDAVYEIRELHAAVMRAVETLPPEQQAVVRLHYLGGLTLVEIGVLAGTPLGTLKARLHRARERLRAELLLELEAYGPTETRRERPGMIAVVVQDVIVRRHRAEDAGAPDQVALPAGSGTVFLKPDSEPAVFTRHRVVLLKEKDGERVLPIWVGPHEGDVLALQLAGRSAPRPLTYDLTMRLLEAAQAAVERVSVSRLHEEVFYATLFLRAGGVVHEIDARPSDALNLALRAGAPIFVDADVMDDQGVRPEALPAKLAREAEWPADDIEWVSSPPPDFSLPARRTGAP